MTRLFGARKTPLDPIDQCVGELDTHGFLKKKARYQLKTLEKLFALVEESANTKAKLLGSGVLDAIAKLLLSHANGLFRPMGVGVLSMLCQISLDFAGVIEHRDTMIQTHGFCHAVLDEWISSNSRLTEKRAKELLRGAGEEFDLFLAWTHCICLLIPYASIEIGASGEKQVVGVGKEQNNLALPDTFGEIFAALENIEKSSLVAIRKQALRNGTYQLCSRLLGGTMQGTLNMGAGPKLYEKWLLELVRADDPDACEQLAHGVYFIAQKPELLMQLLDLNVVEALLTKLGVDLARMCKEEKAGGRGYATSSLMSRGVQARSTGAAATNGEAKIAGLACTWIFKVLLLCSQVTIT
jgi:hypothetical protein